jgi:hypothetical protein
MRHLVRSLQISTLTLALWTLQGALAPPAEALVYRHVKSPQARCWQTVTTVLSVDTTPGGEHWGRVQLPFAFPFFDLRAEALRVHSSGFVQLELQSPESTGSGKGVPYTPKHACKDAACHGAPPLGPHGGPSIPDLILAPLWYDWILDPQSSITSGFVDASTRAQRCGAAKTAQGTFVISFNDLVSKSGELRASFQLQISPDGSFAFAYDKVFAQRASLLAALQRGEVGNIGIAPRAGARYAMSLAPLLASGAAQLAKGSVIAFEAAPSTPTQLDPFRRQAPAIVERWAPDFRQDWRTWFADDCGQSCNDSVVPITPGCRPKKHVVYYSYAASKTHHFIGYYLHHAYFCELVFSYTHDVGGVVLAVARAPERLDAVLYGAYVLEAAPALRTDASQEVQLRQTYQPEVPWVTLLPRQHTCAGKPCSYERPSFGLANDTHRLFARWDHSGVIGASGVGGTQGPGGNGYVLTYDADASPDAVTNAVESSKYPEQPRHRYELRSLEPIFARARCSADGDCCSDDPDALFRCDDASRLPRPRPRLLFRFGAKGLPSFSYLPPWMLAGTLPWAWGNNNPASNAFPWGYEIRRHVCEAHPLRGLRRSNVYADPARVFHDHLRWPSPDAFDVPRTPWCYDTLPGEESPRSIETLCPIPSYAGSRGDNANPNCE